MTTTRPSSAVPQTGPWWGTDAHRAFLVEDAVRQFAFFRPALDPAGGFHAQDFDGRPIAEAPRELLATTRMVHSFALGALVGVPGAEQMVDHGMRAIWDHHRDKRHGGYFWSFLPGGDIADTSKLAYGHAFVLLAGSSAKLIGHPDADRLIADVRDVIDARFWDAAQSRMTEEYARNWQPISTYRGMNANMHSAEAFLAAAEATGEMALAERARAIFAFFVGHMGRLNGWRLPEHYTADWQVDAGYEGNPMFRPAGTTPGHSFEFARLMLQAWDLGGRKDAALREGAEELYTRAQADGWDTERGGICYTVDANGGPLRRNRYWWPVTEAIGAAAALLKTGSAREEDYRRYWQAAERLFIDPVRGGWYPEASDDPSSEPRQFAGKPDIYHSIQATLYPLAPGLSRLATQLPSLGQEFAAQL